VKTDLLSKKFALLIVAACLNLPQTAFGEFIRIEAEDTTATYDKFFYPIQVETATGCSGTILVGIDFVGEWAEYSFPVTEMGLSTFGIRCRGDAGMEYEFDVTFTGNESGATQTVGISYSGRGYT
jgi:hypothetical protein